eukprot:scaffold17843_cov131-Isochrysis_galbana.AAC.1
MSAHNNNSCERRLTDATDPRSFPPPPLPTTPLSPSNAGVLVPHAAVAEDDLDKEDEGLRRTAPAQATVYR